jgi:ABC-2 type transport system ATP-binding protein
MTNNTKPAIEVAALSKRYGATIAVDDLSFTVPYGRIVGFLGPNGAGKTTTLRAILGLVRPSSGTATIGGRRYDELENPVRGVGASLDSGTLHPGRSGRDHLRVLARTSGIGDDMVDRVLALVDLSSAAGRRAGAYSLGMRQRLGLAAALLGNPGILVLDEPANGLDPQGIRWLRDFLRSLADEGRAVLVSSHVLAEVAQTVDDVVVIRNGRSVAQAPLDRLLVEHGGGVRIAGPDTPTLETLFRRRGAHVMPEEAGGIVVRDRTVDEVGEVVAAGRLVITELAPVGPSLEEIYMELTGNPNGGPS